MNRFTALGLVAVLASPAHATTLTDIFDSFYVLGDSLSDNGNTAVMVGTIAAQQDPATLKFRAPEPRQAPGVSSDGPTWADSFTTEFESAGKKTANLSFGAARATTNSDGPPDLNAQIFDADSAGPGFDTFTTSFTFNQDATDEFTIAGTAPKYPGGGDALAARLGVDGERELVTVFIGGNDFLDAAPTFGVLLGEAFAAGQADDIEALATIQKQITDKQSQLISATLNSVTEAIGAIAAQGVNDFIVMNLPDFSVIPQFTTSNPGLTPLGSLLGGTANAFNLQLTEALKTFRLSEINITEVDIFGLLSDADLLSQGGITEFNLACILQEVENCEGYLFFDNIHPTTRAHGIVADATREALSATYTTPVPLPAPALLLVTAAGGLAALRRRKRHA